MTVADAADDAGAGRAGTYPGRMLDSVGAGLIAGGAALLLWTFLGSHPAETFGEIERGRRERNAWLESRVSSVATAAGAILLLLAHDRDRWPALASGLAAVAACYLVLAVKTHREYGRVLRYVHHQADAGGTVPQYVEALLGVRTDAPSRPAGTVTPNTIFPRSTAGLSGIGGLATGVRARAEERASWRWAFTHPTGARNRGM
jgi:hypothetical protein